MKKQFPILLLLALLSTSVPAFAGNESQPASKGDISPYRRDMLKRVASTWHPKQSDKTITVSIKVAKDGKLSDCSVVQSSGDKAFDKDAIDSIKTTSFAPLPDWYTSQDCTFKVDLSKTSPKSGTKSK